MLPLLVSLSLPLAVVALGHVGPRTGVSPPTDLCSYLDGPLLVSGINMGHLAQCLCLSDLSTTVASNPVTKKAAQLLGSDLVNTALTRMLLADSHVEECTYPPRAIPSCIPSSPCAFKCSDGFQPWPADEPTSCACDEREGLTVCGGQCGRFQSCADDSLKTHAHAQSIEALRKRGNGAISASRRRTMCPRGQTPCGRYGRRWIDNKPQWECVDTATNEQSCGGCAAPLDAFSPIGKDCTAVLGADETRCVRGTCVVWTCQDGFEVSLDRSTCIFVGYDY